ncbi:DUF1905 domain-containing protein, partial [Enterococcus faecium]
MTEELAGEHRLFEKRNCDKTFVTVPSFFCYAILDVKNRRNKMREIYSFESKIYASEVDKGGAYIIFPY